MNRGGQTQPPAGGRPVGGGGSGLAPNIASMLCYICTPITGVIFLLIEKENQDVKFHAWQSLVLGASFWIINIVLKFLAVIMGFVAGVLEVIIGIFFPLVGLAALILWIVCLIKAYQGERWRIPVIGDFAAKMAGTI